MQRYKANLLELYEQNQKETAKTAKEQLRVVQIRLPVECRAKIDEIAAEAGQLPAVYMRRVIMALLEPYTDPELAGYMLSIEGCMPADPLAIKTRVTGLSNRRLIGGNAIRLSQEAYEKVKTRAESHNITVSLFLRYMFASM